MGLARPVPHKQQIGLLQALSRAHPRARSHHRVRLQRHPSRPRRIAAPCRAGLLAKARRSALGLARGPDRESRDPLASQQLPRSRLARRPATAAPQLLHAHISRCRAIQKHGGDLLCRLPGSAGWRGLKWRVLAGSAAARRSVSACIFVVAWGPDVGSGGSCGEACPVAAELRWARRRPCEACVP